MKKLFTGLAFPVVGLAAHAAGPFDGIYYSPATASFHLIHTNGNVIVAIGLHQLAVSDTFIPTTVGPMRAFSIPNWDSATGILPNNVAQMSGAEQFGACNITGTITFFQDTALFKIVTAMETPLAYRGPASGAGVKCKALITPAPRYLERAF